MRRWACTRTRSGTSRTSATSGRRGPTPARHTQLLKLAYPAIKAVDPTATVISAGLSPYGAYGEKDAQHMNPLSFLEQMYANGAAGSFDALGWQAQFVQDLYAQLKAWSWAGPNTSDVEQNFGIVHYDWTPKLSYTAYQTAAAAG